jgi:hypothetical protein
MLKALTYPFLIYNKKFLKRINNRTQSEAYSYKTKQQTHLNQIKTALNCMRKSAIIPIVIVFIFWAAKAVAQGDYRPGHYEKIIKKGALVGVKSTYKRNKGQIPAAYDSLKGSPFFVFAFKNAKVDVYKRDIFFPLYLTSVLPRDIPMILSFSDNNLSMIKSGRSATLIYENGLWGWKTMSTNHHVAAQYDSIKIFKDWYYKVYKGGKTGLADVNNTLLVPLLDYEILEEKLGDVYKLYTTDKNTGNGLLGLYHSSVHKMIIPRYQQVYRKPFSKTVNYKSTNYYEWIAATNPDGKVDYYDTRSLTLLPAEDAASIIAINTKNTEEGEAHKKQMVINEQRKKEVYAGLRVFRNEQGSLGILDAGGKVIVPAGLRSISLGWNDGGSIEWEWKAAPGKHGLLFPDGYLRDNFARHDNDTMILFRDKIKLMDPQLEFHFSTKYDNHPDLSLAPEGGFKNFSRFDKCSNCKYGKIPAHSYQVKQDYTIAPAKTTTTTEKLVSRDLDKDGKFPTRTTTTYTPALKGTRSHTVYEPEKICDKCEGKGNIAEIITWNNLLQRFDRKVFGAATNPLLNPK